MPFKSSIYRQHGNACSLEVGTNSNESSRWGLGIIVRVKFQDPDGDATFWMRVHKGTFVH